jgi:hypothetical protein
LESDGMTDMPSRYKQILDANSAETPQRWKRFAQRIPPMYGEGAAWGALANGYKKAADIVAKEYVENIRYSDTLWQPILFLYRHWVELELKALWKKYFSFGALDSEPPEHHSLSPLWHKIREISSSLGILDKEEEFVVRVERSINLFNSIDSVSTHSRYPVVNGAYHSLGISGIEALICAVDDIDTLFYGLGVMIDQSYDPF